MDRDMILYAVALTVLGALTLVLGFQPAYAGDAGLVDPGYLPLPPECKFTPGPATLPTHGPIAVIDGLPVMTIIMDRNHFGF